MHLTRRVDLHQVGSHSEEGCFDAFLGARPCRSPQAIERGVVALTSCIFLHQAEAIRGDVQLGAISILQLHELPTLVLDIKERHAPIASNAIVDMHDAFAGPEGGKVIQKLGARVGGRRFLLFLFAKNIGVAQHHEAHLRPDKALAEMADTDQQRSRAEHVV